MSEIQRHDHGIASLADAAVVMCVIVIGLLIGIGSAGVYTVDRYFEQRAKFELRGAEQYLKDHKIELPKK